MCERCDASSHRFASRRGFLAGAAALAGMAGLAGGPAFMRPAFAQAPNAIPPEEALQLLIDGNARYLAGDPLDTDYEAARAKQASVQYPFASILSCADSRVPPEIVFDHGPGDLFVVRVAGNVAADDGIASLEYGSAVLGVPLILVLGHTSCGAVDAAIKVVKDNAVLPGHLPELIDRITPAVRTAMAGNPPNLLAAATAQNVQDTMTRIGEKSMVLSELIARGKVKVVGGIYELASGAVTLLT